MPLLRSTRAVDTPRPRNAAPQEAWHETSRETDETSRETDETSREVDETSREPDWDALQIRARWHETGLQQAAHTPCPPRVGSDSGSISFGELIQGLAVMSPSTSTSDKMKLAFLLTDLDGAGGALVVTSRYM